MGNRFIIRDNFAFSTPELIKDASEITAKALNSNKTTKLRVIVDATHSGCIINNRVYPGKAMLNAAPSWCDSQHGGKAAYNKPVLKHHNSGAGWSPAEDPIGRVVGYRYTQTKFGGEFEQDFRMPDLEGKGSGMITLTTEISDPDAIQKILDGRLNTVSVGQFVGAVYCSICGENFASDERCEHMPGEEYEAEDGNKYKCYGITDDMEYIEVSFVNVPALSTARVLSFEKLQDSTVRWDWDSDCTSMRVNSIAVYDSNGLVELTIDKEQTMGDGKVVVAIPPGVKIAPLGEEQQAKDTVKKAEETNTVQNQPADDATVVVSKVEMTEDDFALANVARSLMTSGHYLDSPADKVSSGTFDGGVKLVKIGDAEHSHMVICQIEDTGVVTGFTYTTDGSVECEHDHAIEGAFLKDGKLVGTTRSAIPLQRNGIAGPDHTHEFELVADCEVPEDSTVQELVTSLDTMESDETDAKLSPERRNKLKSSTFCGPNRSFPVPDCAHVTAARRLIGRYKGTASAKARILSCINSKAKGLGCGDSTKDSMKLQKAVEGQAQKTEPKAVETQEPKKDETVQSAQNSASLDVDKLTALISELAGCKTQISSLEALLKDRNDEVRKLTDASAQVTSQVAKDLATALAVMRVVLKKPDGLVAKTTEKFNALVDGLATRSLASLRDGISDLRSELDLVLQESLGVSSIILSKEPLERKTLVRKDSSERGKSGKSKTTSGSLEDELD